MRGITRHIRTGLLVLTVCVMALSHANAAFAREAKRILVITSHNPDTKRIALITDFTLGGLAMQTHVIRHMKRHKDIELVLLDGRSNTMFEICNKLKNLNGKNTVLWLGTWHIDSSENYSLTSTDDVLRKANPQIPAFSLSPTGMGNWAIGGYTPEYTPQGKMLADMAIEYLYGKKTRGSLFHIIPSTYTFDQKMLEAFNKEDAELPQDAVVLNTATHFFSANKSIILSTLAVFAFLAIALVLAIYYLLKMKRLRDALEIQSEELKRAKDIAERANNVKTSFIANMSHELRTPLNAIVGFANLLEEDDYEEEEKKQFCHVIKENSDMLLNLISDILDISKIESGKLPISPEECDVIALSRTSILSVKHASKLEDVEYIEDFPSDERLMIYTDPIRLKQVMINLLSNASKYTKKGFIKLTIRPDYDTDYITFAVTDTGCGIPEDKAEMVFGRFVKLKQYVQGTGLGLPLCRVLTESMGGKIWLDTSYTNGTRMVFTHPLNLNKTSRGGRLSENYSHVG